MVGLFFSRSHDTAAIGGCTTSLALLIEPAMRRRESAGSRSRAARPCPRCRGWSRCPPPTPRERGIGCLRSRRATTADRRLPRPMSASSSSWSAAAVAHHALPARVVDPVERALEGLQRCRAAARRAGRLPLLHGLRNAGYWSAPWPCARTAASRDSVAWLAVMISTRSPYGARS